MAVLTLDNYWLWLERMPRTSPNTPESWWEQMSGGRKLDRSQMRPGEVSVEQEWGLKGDLKIPQSQGSVWLELQ